jgi:hydroxymethylglutaryl-CoA lyase
MIKIIECPRDAMQGMSDFVDTAVKAAYINQLLQVGFDTIDFGSFVSPKAIPQLKDTEEVIGLLDLYESKSKLLAIIANIRGANDALLFEEIDFLGFPLSVSEEFQKRNTNKTINEALHEVEEIQNLCEVKGKRLVVYLSMCFGNPYQEKYSPEMVASFVKELDEMGIKTISFADTIGVASPELIEKLFKIHTQEYPQIEFGAHFHTHPNLMNSRITSAIKGGCKRFDAAIKGFGGCPFANDKLVGNVATESLISLLETLGFSLSINKMEFKEALKLSGAVFH